jgi:hypothetical protein
MRRRINRLVNVRCEIDAALEVARRQERVDRDIRSKDEAASDLRIAHEIEKTKKKNKKN